VTALVYCNGAPISDELFSEYRRQSDLLIAADGGAYNVLQHGSLPDVIIGDLDSYTDPGPAGCEVIHDPDQETNDLQKALSYALQRAARRAVVAGAIGDRLDHELNNLSVLLEFSRRFDSLWMIDNFGRYFVAEPQQGLQTAAGKVVSLFPLSGRVDGITTSGLQYPLHNEALENGVRNGCLNQASAAAVTVTHRSGALLLIVQH